MARFVHQGATLEHNFQRQLHVEGLAGTDARRPVKISGGVAALPESTSNEAGRRRQVDAVEQIEKLDAELGAESFRDRYVLEDGEINVAESRRVDGIASHGSERTLCRIGVRVRIDPLDGIVIDERMRNALERIADLDATGAVFASPVCIGRGVDGEWKPGAEGEVGIQLPSVGNPSGAMGRAGDVVKEEGAEVVPDIIIGVAVVALEVGGVLRERAHILSDFVEAVAPGVRKL